MGAQRDNGNRRGAKEDSFLTLLLLHLLDILISFLIIVIIVVFRS